MASQSYYLGPGEGVLELSSWESLVVAAAAGLLDESHWVELKKDVPAKSEGSNLELARDVASLSVDGGLLLIGVEDNKGKAGEVVGVVGGAALADRVVQVARSIIHPPVQIEVNQLASPDGSTETVAIRVPASALAPHMVDHRYWGRSDVGKTALSDSEVSRLFDIRRTRHEDFVGVMRDAQTRDLVAPEDRIFGHGYVVMRPLAYNDTTGQINPVTSLTSTIRGALGHVRPQWAPAMDKVSADLPHPDGLMCTSSSWPTGPSPFGQMQVLLRDSGQLEVVSGEVTTSGLDRTPEAVQTIPAGHALELVHCSMIVAAHVGDHHLGYWGQWQVGVIFDGLKGLYSSSARSHLGYSNPPFPSDEYVRSVVTTTSELMNDPANVVDRLLRPFIRGLGLERRFLPYSDLAEIYAKNK